MITAACASNHVITLVNLLSAGNRRDNAITAFTHRGQSLKLWVDITCVLPLKYAYRMPFDVILVPI